MQCLETGTDADMDAGQLERRRWTSLLSWMEERGFDASDLCVEPQSRNGKGRGLFVTKDLEPLEQTFLRFPESVLLNSKTLSALYPTIPLEGFPDCPSSGLVLNGTQLLSIHLALNCFEGDHDISRDEHFGPFLSCLPRNFNSHPLKWIIKEKMGTADESERYLLHSLPPSVARDLRDVARRFWDDWEVALQCVKEHRYVLFSGCLKDDFSVDDFKWGWLIVNTRCLYAKLFHGNYPLSNLTLCPLLDFANHTASASVPQLSVEGFTKIHPGSSGDSEDEEDELELDEFVVKLPNQFVAKGEEIFLRYGGHSNRMLFTEYGFVDDSVEPEVDVTEQVDELVSRKFPGLTIKDLLPLDKHHFLSDLRAYAFPTPAQPSWSLLCALRLVNISFPPGYKPGSEDENHVLKSWRAMTNGETEVVSDLNENAVRRDLQWICEVVAVRSVDNLNKLQGKAPREDELDWVRWAKSCIIKLWEEERRVSRAVEETLRSGYKF